MKWSERSSTAQQTAGRAVPHRAGASAGSAVLSRGLSSPALRGEQRRGGSGTARACPARLPACPLATSSPPPERSAASAAPAQGTPVQGPGTAAAERKTAPCSAASELPCRGRADGARCSLARRSSGAPGASQPRTGRSPQCRRRCHPGAVSVLFWLPGARVHTGPGQDGLCRGVGSRSAGTRGCSAPRL